MSYSHQYTREEIFRSNKLNTPGNFLIALGVWVITPDNPGFTSYLYSFLGVLSLLTLSILSLSFFYKKDLPESKQRNLEELYFIFGFMISLVLGFMLVFEGIFFGFLSTPHLGTWVFIVAITEALASLLYHRPKFFVFNFMALNIPSILWLISIGSTKSYLLAAIVLAYGPMISMRVFELKKLKDSKLSLYEQSISREKHLQQFLDLIPAKISWLDSDLKYIGVNKTFQNTSEKYQRRNFIGQPFGERQPDAPITIELKKFFHSEQRKKHCELQVQVGDEQRWHLCEFTKKSFEQGDEIFLISLDIHDRKILEEELNHQKDITEQAAKLVSLGEMAAGIAHEINNPLTIIQGSSQLIYRMYEKGALTDDALATHLPRIVNTSKRIVSVIKGMKDFSRNTKDADFEIESIKTIIDETLSFSLEKFKSKFIDVILKDIDETLSCHCRPQQINQILLNFLNNSYDAVLDNSNTPKTIEISTEDYQDMFALCITDTGEKDLDLEKLFTPYYTTKARGEGTGIGLSISQKIAQSHNGYIKAFRENNKTTFKLYLPKIDKQIKEKKKSA